jgi:hypothetical protein
MLEVGQTLWFVPSDTRWNREREMTVKKVGRKWAKTDERTRVDIKTLMVCGGNYSSPGRCYLSRDEWESEKARKAAWSDLRRCIDRSWHIPAGVSLDHIKQAMALLGFEEGGA